VRTSRWTSSPLETTTVGGEEVLAIGNEAHANHIARTRVTATCIRDREPRGVVAPDVNHRRVTEWLDDLHGSDERTVGRGHERYVLRTNANAQALVGEPFAE